MEHLPKQYDIQELLDSAVQPFEPADDEWIKRVAKMVKGGGGLPDPVSVTKDGILVDGSQRLTAMKRAGRVIISASEVHVIDGATKDNAWDYAIMLNASRRQLTLEQKAAVARQLIRERGWSQRRVADAFGVSRPAVSQWLSRVADPDPSPGPIAVTGKDGKRYFTDPAPHSGQEPDAEPERIVSPWHPSKGRTARAVSSALRSIRNSSGETFNLTAIQRAALEQNLADLVEACEDALQRLSDES